MKKALALLVAMALALSISACVGLKDTPPNPDVTSSETGSNANQTESKNENILSVPNKENQKPNADSSDTQSITIENSKISKEKAIEIALENAKLKRDDIRELKAELELEANGLFWEIDFEYGGYDYSYEINAKDGKIVRSAQEKD